MNSKSRKERQMKKKEIKRAEAIERKNEYDKLTPTQKIEKLDKRLGVGQGAKKERLKLKTHN